MDLNLEFHHTVDILLISKFSELVWWFIPWFKISVLDLFKNAISWVSCSCSFSVELAQGSFTAIRGVLLKKASHILPLIFFISYSKTIESVEKKLHPRV